MKVKFSECVEYMIKGPFGSDMKKSLYVPQGENTYKVYIQGNAIQKDENLGDYYVSSEYFHQKLERFQVHPGDYIITCDGTLGKYIKLSDNIEPGVISSSLLLLKLDENKIYDKYFELLWEHSMLRYLASQARNACLVHLPSAKAIGDVEIVLPDMSIQKEIADKAFLIKAIIKKRNDELELLDELIKARFVELFGDPVSNPHGFDKVALSELADIKIGPFGSLLHKEDYIEGGHALLNPSHIIDGKVAPDNKLTVSNQKYEELSAYHLKIGDVVMGRRGEMGRCAVVPCDGYLCGTGSLMIRAKGQVTADYIQKIISFPSFKKTIDDMAVGQTMPNLNVPIVSNFQIIKPPIEVQESYYAFIEQTDKSKVVVQKALDEAQLLFDSLMQKYFG